MYAEWLEDTRAAYTRRRRVEETAMEDVELWSHLLTTDNFVIHE